MTLISKVRKDIGKAKEKLEGKPVTENFGQREVRKIRDKYNSSFVLDDCNVNERNQILDMINAFDEWCQSYC